MKNAMDDLPNSAKRRRRSWSAAIWLVPIIAAGAIGYAIFRTINQEGPTLHIIFRSAEGLEVDKTDLRFRGVKMGEVKDLQLTSDMKHVDATVELKKSAEGLARKGSQFWLVQPHVSATQIRGLNTIVSGAYIGASAGTGEKQTEFKALEQAPPINAGERELTIYVVSDQGTFEPGAPVLYRSIKVGAVANSELSDDARNVKARLLIEYPYDRLVRSNSRFWNAGGTKMHFGLFSGLEVAAQSFSTMLTGGIEFATPDEPGARVKDNAVFPLADKADDAWKKWRPAISLAAQPAESER